MEKLSINTVPFNTVTSYGSGIKTDLKDFSPQSFEKKFTPSFKQIINLPKEVEKYDLSTVPKEYQKYFSSLLFKEENSINEIHYNSIKKYPKNTIFLIIPKNTQLNEPLTITTNINAGSTSSHIIIIAEESSSASIIETITSTKETYAITSFKEIILTQNATLNIYQKHNLHPNTFYFSKNKTSQSTNSKFRLIDNVSGGKSIEHHNTFQLEKSSSIAHHYLAFTASNDADYDIISQTQQSAPNTESKLICKGLIQDEAKALFQGKVNIHSAAHNSKGEQRTDLLLIGDKARGEAVPILNVQNNEISCTHAATIAQINDEHLFYLTSRGLDKSQAKEMIRSGFLAPIIDLFPENTSIQQLNIN